MPAGAFIILRSEQPSERGVETQSGKVIARDQFAAHHLGGAFAAFEAESLSCEVNKQIAEDLIVVAVINVIGIRELTWIDRVRLYCVKRNETIGLTHRHWLEQYAVDECEDRRVHRNA